MPHHFVCIYYGHVVIQVIKGQSSGYSNIIFGLETLRKFRNTVVSCTTHFKVFLKGHSFRRLITSLPSILININFNFSGNGFSDFVPNFSEWLGVYYALIIKKCKGTKNTIFSFLYWGSPETGIIVIILHVLWQLVCV